MNFLGPAGCIRNIGYGDTNAVGAQVMVNPIHFTHRYDSY